MQVVKHEDDPITYVYRFAHEEKQHTRKCTRCETLSLLKPEGSKGCVCVCRYTCDNSYWYIFENFKKGLIF